MYTYVSTITHTETEGKKSKKQNQATKSHGHPDSAHTTSIPPHSNTRNSVRSDARTASTPTTFVQNVAPSSAVARAAAEAQRPKSSERIPRKSMKMRVMTSGAGEMRSRAAVSYDACAMKRKATYSCLSKLGSQYLHDHPRPDNPVPGKCLKAFPFVFLRGVTGADWRKMKLGKSAR